MLIPFIQSTINQSIKSVKPNQSINHWKYKWSNVSSQGVNKTVWAHISLHVSERNIHTFKRKIHSPTQLLLESYHVCDGIFSISLDWHEYKFAIAGNRKLISSFFFPNQDSMPMETPKKETNMTETRAFQHLLKDLPVKLSDQTARNLSVPIAFVCLLHLANEKVIIPSTHTVHVYC